MAALIVLEGNAKRAEEMEGYLLARAKFSEVFDVTTGESGVYT